MTEVLTNQQWISSLKDVVCSGHILESDRAYEMMDAIMSGHVDAVAISALLTAIAVRGASPCEVRGFSDAMRDHAVPLHVDTAGAVDIVGTGGDGAHTVNISTMAAVLVAACGTPVIKHGNRAATSMSGSADVLEALGVILSEDPEVVARIFKRVGITFCFANAFHPAMRFVAPVRRSIGFPTVFNILGPLTNPGRPKISVIGASSHKALDLIANTLAERGDTGLVFVSEDRCLDELAAVEPHRVIEVRAGKTYESHLDLTEIGLTAHGIAELRGGSAQHNADIAREVLGGKDSIIAQTVAINAAAGLVVSGTNFDPCVPLGERMRQAYIRAYEVLASGAGEQKLDEWIRACASA